MAPPPVEASEAVEVEEEEEEEEEGMKRPKRR